MSEFVATVLDVTGIQPYIFGSNRLRENIGASYLAAQATEAWAGEALQELGRLTDRDVYVPDPTIDAPENARRIEDNVMAAELVYAGGGNTVLLFADIDLARQFTRLLTARTLNEAPGLAVVVAHRPFKREDNDLATVVGDLVAIEVDRRKRERLPSAPLLGLGVTAACASTGLPAVDTSDHHGVPDTPYPVSRETVAKLDAVSKANSNLATTLGVDQQILPYDLDNLGRTEGTSSYVAVVHADGNSVGQRFIHAGGDQYADNRSYIEAMRRLSSNVHRAGRAALRRVYGRLMDSIDSQEGYIRSTDAEGNSVRHFALSRRTGHAGRDLGWYLPFRPLVYGGDDVTFVCDGRLGLSLAALFLDAFEQESAALDKPLTACAGICIAKTHYPFARAYNLSEALSRSAKRYVRAGSKARGDGAIFSALDWHIAGTGPTESLGEIREREYRVPAGRLEMRPVYLNKQREWQTWPGVRAAVRELANGEDWRGRRNKVLALREALRQGPEETEKFLKAYRPDRLPPFEGVEAHDTTGSLQSSGWLTGICGYFDAIEALDFLVDLDTEMST